LALIDGQAYAVAWPLARHAATTRWDAQTQRHVPLDQPLITTRQDVLIVRQDGAAFGNGGDYPLADLDLKLDLRLVLAAERQWSPAALQAYRAGHRPDPVAVFARLCAVFDAFADFDRSLAPQSLMCELCALFVFTTWMSDSCSQLGYLWLSGDGGDNQARLFDTLTQLSFLGAPVPLRTDSTVLRNLSAYGSALAYDFTNFRNPSTALEPAQRASILAGRRRGMVPAAQDFDPFGQRWLLSSASTYCPRFFTALGPPDPKLSAVSIVIPLIRVPPGPRAQLNPLLPAAWPASRSILLDDLWAVSLANLSVIPAHESAAADTASLSGEALGPWRAVLAIAHWLEHAGVPSLFQRLRTLAAAYQAEQWSLRADDLTTLIVQALVTRYTGLLRPKGESVPDTVDISTAEVISAAQLMLTSDSTISRADLTPQRVGRLLAQLRLHAVQRDRLSHTRLWRLTSGELASLAQAYGVSLPQPPTTPSSLSSP
jgi:hypothetical protein